MGMVSMKHLIFTVSLTLGLSSMTQAAQLEPHVANKNTSIIKNVADSMKNQDKQTATNKQVSFDQLLKDINTQKSAPAPSREENLALASINSSSQNYFYGKNKNLRSFFQNLFGS